MSWRPGRRVLIADTEPSVRRDLAARLLDLDVFSDGAATVRDALERLDEGGYAVVLLDLGLGPESDRLLARVAAIPSRDRPIVLATGTAEAIAAVSDHVVQIVMRRPFKLTPIAELVASCIPPGGDETPASQQPPKPRQPLLP